MKRPDVHTLVETVSKSLAATLGGRFLGFIVFGSLMEAHYDPERSDVNTLLVVTDETNLNQARHAFLPIWEAYGDTLKRAPLVFTRTSFYRYLELFPEFTAHLRRRGKQLGDPPLPLPTGPEPAPDLIRAYEANELIVASRLLAVDLLDDSRRRYAERSLDRLLRTFNVADDSLSLAEKISFLAQRFETKLEVPQPEDTPPYGINGLIAIYESLGNDYFVVGNASDIAAIDCTEAVEEFSDREITSLNIGTLSQFKLVVEQLYPLDVALFSYQRIWGVDLLKDVRPAPEAVLRHAARFATFLEVETFPNALLTHASDEVFDSKMIHDFQNKLLNIRLQNDLLYRLKISKQGEPSPLPGRQEPHPVRLQAIWEQFRWWTAFYEEIIRSIVPTVA